MRVVRHFVSLAVILASWSVAQGDERVTFESATVKPSAFRERLAQQRGETLTQSSGTRLIGYLSRPPGDGPFPAVVVMHGCGGIRPSTKTDWPERLVSWGYAVLVVDSFTTRKIENTCDSYLADRVFDAYGAMDFLSKYPFVDNQRIGLMGFSAGGIIPAGPGPDSPGSNRLRLLIQ